MAQTASRVGETPDLTHNSGNASPLSIAQLNTKTDPSHMASHLAHDRNIFGERNDTMDPPDLSSYQEWIPAEDESYQLDDSYLSPWLPNIPEEAAFNSIQAAESPENLYWTEPEFASDLLDGSLWSTESSPRDIIDDQLSPLYECNEELPTVSDEKPTHDEAVEDRGNKRRKRSSSVDHQAADIEEQKRVRRIIRNLEHFENEQRLYGKQQLRAIKDGFS
ncbi:hypothetical protein GGI43DRAFT_429737 [Trichoderma evansii]